MDASAVKTCMCNKLSFAENKRYRIKAKNNKFKVSSLTILQ